MNLNNLFEGAIDDLEKRRIEDLELKMDDLAARAKESKDPKVIAALRQEFAKAKAERDSYHYVSEEGSNTTAFDRKGNKVPVYIPTKDEDELDEHGGGGGGPAQWHAYVRAHRTDEGVSSDKATIAKLMAPAFVDGSGGNFSYMLERKCPTMDALRTEYHDDLDAMFAQASEEELAQAAQELKAWLEPVAEAKADTTGSWVVYNGSKVVKFKTHSGATAYAAKNGGKVASSEFYADKVQGVKEGFQDFNKVEPYAVCLAGKPVKKFDYYEEARRFHDNWKKKLYNQGDKEKADKITLMPLNLDEGYHANTIGAMASMAPTFKVGDAMWTRDENGRPVSGEVVELRPGTVVFKTEDGRKFRAPEGRVMKRVHEGSMSDASHHSTGPEFGGYYKGTQVGAPRPGQSFGAESKEMEESAPTNTLRNFVVKNMKQSGQGKHKDEKRAMKHGDVKHKAKAIPAEVEEGAKVDRMVKHITKSEKDTGKSAKDAEAIAWATANKRGMLNNANKKKTNEAMNFMEWAVSQGSRFANFTNNPETYAQAKEAYVAEGMSNALSNITRRIAQPVNAKTIIKNREQKKDSLKRQHFAEDDVTEMFGPEWQAVGGALTFAKEHGIPIMAFAAVAAAYGISKAAKELEQGESRFKKLAAKAIKAVDKNVIHKMANKLHDFGSAVMAEEYKPVTRPVPQPRKLNPGWALDPTTKAELKRRKDRNKTISKYAGKDVPISEIKKGAKDSNGNTGCWDGYHAQGTKKGKNGGQVRNCVPNESIEEDWQKANKKDKTDGMSQKAVNAYKRENPGSKLKTAVTTKPSKLKKGSKDSKRRKSYCARSAGQKKMHNIDCSKTPDKAICKARRRWNCESQEQFDSMLREAVEKSELQPGQYYVWTVYFDDGTNKRVKVTKDTFDPKAYYAKENKVVVNVDYDWTPKNG